MQLARKAPRLALSAALLGLFASPALAQFTAVGVYDENTVNTNTIEQEAGISNITLANFKTVVSSAFTAGTGGVINFDVALANSSSFNTSFNGGLSTLTVTMNAAAGANQWNTTNQDSNTWALSGSRYLGTNASSQARFDFSQPLSHFGITMLWRNANRTGTVTVFFDDNTSASVGSFSSSSGSLVGTVNQTPDVFFGYVAPTGKAITRIDIIGDGFVRYDDLGFVTAIPEPSSVAALAGLGALGLVAMRRRRRA
jgi:hypothetical protein